MSFTTTFFLFTLKWKLVPTTFLRDIFGHSSSILKSSTKSSTRDFSFHVMYILDPSSLSFNILITMTFPLIYRHVFSFFHPILSHISQKFKEQSLRWRPIPKYVLKSVTPFTVCTKEHQIWTGVTGKSNSSTTLGEVNSRRIWTEGLKVPEESSREKSNN